MNKIVLKRAVLPTVAVLLAVGSPAQAKVSRPKLQKSSEAAVTEQAKAASEAAARSHATYTSASSACLAGRKKLWTESGWVVRRVSSCR